MPTLSVWETLAFTTDLRLPESFSKADKEVLMNEALTNMGLQKVKHSQVQTPALSHHEHTHHMMLHLSSACMHVCMIS